MLQTITRENLANAIRFLSMDAVQKANSGHPGMPMGMAVIAEVLWRDFMRHNPTNPDWVNRDRFVLSNGHGSMLLYSLLHLTGYDLSIDDLKNFRQLHSKTPGHPEYGYTPGVETTTGPLGQGIANAVGMALAEKVLAAQFNKPKYEILNHYTYTFLGDGCLMEGVSHEVCSLAGTLKLGKLIAFWDDNGISIDGKVEGWFTDNTPERFKAYGWHVVADVDGNDPAAISKAIKAAQKATDKPNLICCKTQIGFGSPTKVGTAATHGAPLGDDEIAATRKALKWPHAPFEIPQEIYQAWNAQDAGTQQEASWQALFDDYASHYPQEADELQRRLNGELPQDWDEFAKGWIADVAKEGASVASRKASQMALEAVGPKLPELLGGSADLTGSNLTKWSGSKPITPDNAEGNYVFFGVREFGMSAIANGMALYGGLIPYVATFLVFSDYARNAVRMAALMKQRVIFVYTHDSIGLGEDGPTHQPIEHLASLRMIPNMSLWRPCDAVESAVAWRCAIERQDGPTCLVFSRQTLPNCERSAETRDQIYRGGYVLQEPRQVDIVLVATGSEVALAMESAKVLAEQNIHARVVSMPCLNTFLTQPDEYRHAVIPCNKPRVVLEAGVRNGWSVCAGSQDWVVGIDSFGESAPAEDLFKHFGFTTAHVVDVVKSRLQHKGTTNDNSCCN